MIVARPGGPSEGLKALTESIPGLALVYHVIDHRSALSVVKDCCPDLFLVNIELPNSELVTLLENIKSTCPRSKSIVLSNDAGQQDHLRFAGADVVELIGIPAAQLAATIQGQLEEKGGKDL